MPDIRNNPHFVLFPVNNARTGYKPYSMPILYVEPRRINPDGSGIPGSASLRVKYKVVDAPDSAKVAGSFNQNIRIPEQSLFEIELSDIDLLQRKLDLRSMEFVDSNGNVKSFIDAVEGDFFKYIVTGTNTTKGSNPRDLVKYYPDAIYYDVSNVEINVDQLPRPKRYHFIWEGIFFRRIATVTNGLKCISDEMGITQKVLEVNHPGDVHEFMFKSTPGFYFDYEEFSTATDPTLEFYRPLADALQDVFDEQELLDGINHINKIPAELIPYLSFLIGWDLPNFPGTTDNLRRTFLERGSELQKLKGSKRVINELFETFGFTVDIINLWNSLDGNSLVSLQNQEVTQTDLLLYNYKSQGFGVGDIPFIFTPQKNSEIVLFAWLVSEGSPAYDQLITISNNLSNDLEYANQNINIINKNGIIEPIFVNSIGKNTGNGVIGYSEVIVGSDSFSVGRPILNHNNIKYNNVQNILSLFFDHEMSVNDGKIFIFTSYKRNKIIIPEELSNTRSNKFDIEILNRNGEPIDYNLLLSLLDFLFKLKAFHSILRKIKTSINVTDVYNVTDICIDGEDPFKRDTTLGELQTSPAIMPVDTDECIDDISRGFKDSDYKLRNTILNGLEEEFQGWKLLSDNCEYTSNGQDKVFEDGSGTVCGENPNNLNYCYIGRVKDFFENLRILSLKDNFAFNHCGLRMGDGVYWEQPDINIGKIFKGYEKLSLYGDKKLSYSDSSFLYLDKLISNNYDAINPVSLNIEKDNLNFPSHRLMSMNKIFEDYNYTQSLVNQGYDFDYVRKRPWDDYGFCGEFDQLNAKIVESTYGQILIWDEVYLIYQGNGLIPDIPSLDDHEQSITDGRIITHAIFQFSRPSHPSISFDQTVIVNNGEKIDTYNVVTGPIFDSVCSDTGEDFIGGYPATYNWVNTNSVIFQNDASIENEFELCDDTTCTLGLLDRPAIANMLMLPDTISDRTQARFLSGSMEFVKTSDIDYRYYIPYRLDCDCADDLCLNYSENECNARFMRDKNGDLDISHDKLDIDLRISLTETINLCSRLSNGEINSLFCLNDNCNISEQGNFEYQDDYGIIYDIEWRFSLDVLDITVMRKDPNIPLQEPDGYTEFENGILKIYRKGIITIVRRIIRYDINGSYTEAEGHESYIDYFRSNKVCDEKPFENPFSYGINCAAQDNVQMLVTIGSSWHDPVEELGTEYYWSDPLNPTISDFEWI